MVDYYGLPQKPGRAWPGRVEAAGSSSKGQFVQDAMLEDIAQEVDAPHFIPFVVIHEFEALLFSDCATLSRGINKPEARRQFDDIRAQFQSPEDINDSPLTAPSKRIVAIVRGYQKVHHGALAALEIGLPKMREECPHFNEWVTKLEEVAW